MQISGFIKNNHVSLVHYVCDHQAARRDSKAADANEVFGYQSLNIVVGPEIKLVGDIVRNQQFVEKPGFI